MMKSLVRNCLLGLLCMIVVACGQSGNEIVRIVEERDSLKLTLTEHHNRLNLMNEMISTINLALDSISAEEGLLFVSPSSELPIKRDDALRNLERYEALVRHQQEKIRQLSSAVSKDTVSNSLKGLIEHMKIQLQEKDLQIAQLKEELSKKNVDIEKLRRQVESQRLMIDDQATAIAELDKKTKLQTEALVRQDEVINNGYVLVGSKKDLERKGVLRKKKLVNDAVMDKSKFAKIDIRKWKEVSFEAKRPRILTNMPESSYQLTTTGNKQFTLKITDPSAFWSISNFLVIQTD